MALPRMTIQIEGTAADHGLVRLVDFIEQLETFKAVLRRRTERGGYYRVVDLRHDSPATVVLEYVRGSKEAPSRKAPAIEAMMQDLSRIQQTTRKKPPVQDLDVLESYAEIAAAVEKRVNRIVVKASRRSVTIDESFSRKLTKLIGPDET